MVRNSGELIFQQFNLASERLTEESQKLRVRPGSLQPHERWKKVERALRAYGLSLMCSQSVVDGVPTMVIVGMPMDCIQLFSVKDCFYKLADKYRLPFVSGDWFLGESASRISRSVLSDPNHRAFLELKVDEQWLDEHHGQWAGFAGGNLVVMADDEEAVVDRLRAEHPDQEGFLVQVLTEEEEDKKVIHMP